MRNKMVFSIFLLFMFLFVSCMSLFVNALTVVDLGGIWDMNNRCSVVDSDGKIFVMYVNDSKLYIENSSDNGVTFGGRTLVYDGGSYGDANFIIQSNDYMWVFFWNSTGWDLMYSKSVDGGSTWTTGYVKSYASNDYSINDMSVSVSDNDDIFVVVALRYDGPPTSWSYGYRRFRNATQTWNTWTIYSDSQATFKYDIDSCYLGNGSIFVACRTYDYTNSWYRGQSFFLNDDLEVFGSRTFYNPSSSSYEVNEVNCLLGVDDDVHLFYTRENGGSAKGVYYQKYDVSEESWGSEESIFYSGTYTSWHLTSSYNVNNGPCVMFVRDNIDTSNEKMFFSYKLYSGLWSVASMVNVFNDDVMNNPVFLYQRYPDFCILESGYVVVFDNDTTGLIMYSDTGSLTWWDGYSSEDEGINYGYDTVMCSGGYDGNFDDNLENNRYIDIVFNQVFDLTVNRVELYFPFGIFDYYEANLNNYDLYVNGEDWGIPDTFGSYPYGVMGRSIIWENIDGTYVDNDYVLLSFGSNKLVSGSYWDFIAKADTISLGGSQIFTFMHNSTVYHINTNGDGYMLGTNILTCFYSYINITDQEIYPPIPPDILDDYTDEFGWSTFNDSFIEFKNPYSKCEYRVGESPVIMFNLSDYYLEDGVNFYRYRIFDSDGNLWFSGIINIHGDYQSGYIYLDSDDFEFIYVDDYYIQLYNTTSHGTQYGDELIHSVVIHVCPDDGTTDIDDGTGALGDENLNILIGVMVSVALGIGLFVITHSTGAMLLGIGIGAFMLSNESLGVYQLLPVTVGVGLISLLFVVGFFIWATD